MICSPPKCLPRLVTSDVQSRTIFLQTPCKNFFPGQILDTTLFRMQEGVPNFSFSGCSKRSKLRWSRGARNIDERRRTCTVRWSEAIERNHRNACHRHAMVDEAFSAACQRATVPCEGRSRLVCPNSSDTSVCNRIDLLSCFTGISLAQKKLFGLSASNKHKETLL